MGHMGRIGPWDHGTYRTCENITSPICPIVLWSYTSHMSYTSQSHCPIVLLPWLLSWLLP